jgi:uncharacterized protein (TIGR03437 family)
MILYVAGAGQTSPPSQDGQVNAPPLAAPGMPIQIVSFGTVTNLAEPLPIKFAGSAPGLAAGILQVNFIASQQSSTNLNLVFGSGNMQGSNAQFSVSIQ